MKVLGVIPSRYASSRFPGKPLIDIDGKTMIQRVYEQASKANALSSVIVATDDQKIFDHVKNFGGEVIMTSSAHETGTERCAEVLQKMTTNFDVIINIQGDEPFIDPEQINQVATCFKDDQTQIATLAKKITTNEELFNPNRPKVHLNDDSFAIMFSRNAIPTIEGVDQNKWLEHHTYYKHIGIYGYKTETLEYICKLMPTELEKKERLEQLRWLENNITIKVGITTSEAIAIDTPEDLEKISFK